MNRRTLAAGLVAAALLPGMIPAGAADAPKPEFPRAQCSHRLIDPAGDGYTNPRNAPVNLVKTDGVDIVSTLFRVTPDEVQAFVQMKDIPAPADMDNYDSAFKYTVSFKYEDKTFKASTFQVNPDVDPTGSNAAGSKPAIDPAIPGTRYGVDPTSDYAWFAIPRAAFEDKVQTPIVDGTQFTAISAVTETSMANNQFVGADDMTPVAAAAVWTVDDDYCFGPPPGALSEIATPSVQYTDVSAFTAKLVDEKGAAVAGAPISFAVTTATGTVVGTPVTGTTDAAGVATAPFTATIPAGTYTVKVSFAGTAEVGKAKATSSFVVTVEKTKFLALGVAKPTTTTRTVTATLLDDDNKPVAFQRVDFYVAGKKSSATADKAGKATLKTAKPGQTVQAKLVAVTGKYAAAASTSRKV
jgi:hypothetical protein